MCVVKTPKITQPTAAATTDKPLPVMRNPYLDGIDPLIRSRQTGMSSLRIDRKPAGSSATITRPPASTPTAAPTAAPSASPSSSVNPALAAMLSLGPAGKLALKRMQ